MPGEHRDLQRRPLGARLAVLTSAAAMLLAFAPLPSKVVEQYYSGGIYPFVQTGVTALSNAVPFALLDLLGLGLAAWWVTRLVQDLKQALPGGRGAAGVRILLRTVTMSAALYLAFAAVWGLNYRRLPLEQKIAYDELAVTPEAARSLADRAVRELNVLYGPASASLLSDDGSRLAQAFAGVQEQLRIRPARPASPKWSILDPYFRAAAVDGMTDPFFLETLVVSSLLAIERPFVVAHEWSHLAGFANEGEANFVGWLTCMRGGSGERYSAWLFLHREIAARLSARDRSEVADRLAPGPRADLQAIAVRVRRHVRPALSRAGWQVYDRYLKANRVEAGAASYADVVRIILGTRFGPDWSVSAR